MDIILLQEVTHTDVDRIRGYKVYTEVGMNKRSTAILTRESLQQTHITNLPSGRGILAQNRCVCYIRQEREDFCNVEYCDARV
jgi:hypothetical protein